MISSIQAIQAREGIETTKEQAEMAYDTVTKNKKLQFIQDVTVDGFTHSLLVYGKDDVRWGNKTFTSLKAAKDHIKNSFQKK